MGTESQQRAAVCDRGVGGPTEQTKNAYRQVLGKKHFENECFFWTNK
jgi:hypothetical protein